MCIKGDVNGDGKITSVDMLAGQKHILEIAKLTDAKLKASDANSDGKVSSVDLLVMQKHVLDISTIKQ